MDAMPVVLDISSDDEPCLDALSDNFDWIKEFLGVSGDEADDSDDVVIVGEVKANTKKNREPAKDQEDDCVILDGDPDKSITAGEEIDNGSDEIVVVGQKGQIACRDYPHPRHHCAEFSFTSTPHEKHCHQCHCYVCDSLAPCLYWGTGLSKSDHCHATDKVLMWKVLRRDLKHGSNPTSPASKPTPHANHDPVNQNALVAPNSTLQNQISGSISTRPYHPLPNSMLQNKSSLAPITCAYLSSVDTSRVGSSTFSVHAPHPVNIGQNEVPGGLLSRIRSQNLLIQNQAFHCNTRRDSVQVTRSGSRLGPSSVMLKRSGTNWIGRRVGSSANNSLGNAHPNTATENERNTPSGAYDRCYSGQWSSLQACTNSPYDESTGHPNLLGMNRVPPQSCTYEPSVIQLNDSLELDVLGNRYQIVHPSNNGFQSINRHHDEGEFQNMNQHQDGGGFQNVNPQEDGSGLHNISQQENLHPVDNGFPSENPQGNQYHDGGELIGNHLLGNQQENGDGLHNISQQENLHPVADGFPSENQQGNQYHDGGELLGNHLLGNQHLDGGEFQSIIPEDNQYQLFPHDTYIPERVCMSSQNISQLGNLTENSNQLISDRGILSQNLQNTDYLADPSRCVHNSSQSKYHSTESFQIQEKVGCRNERSSVSGSISLYSSNAIDHEFENWLSDSQSTLRSPELPPPVSGMLFYDVSYSGEI